MIRPYQDDDLAALLDAWHRASEAAHPFLSEAFFEAERHQIAHEWLPMSETQVYVVGGRVVGFLSLVDNEVGGLFVHPDFQRQGIGRALMDSARAARPYLELTVFEANSQGRRFYEAYGFREVERVAEGVEGHPELRLRLGNRQEPQ